MHSIDATRVFDRKLMPKQKRVCIYCSFVVTADHFIGLGRTFSLVCGCAKMVLFVHGYRIHVTGDTCWVFVFILNLSVRPQGLCSL